MDLAHVEASDASLVAESFVWLRIRVQGELQLRSAVNDGSLLYVKFSIDPGNQSAMTSTQNRSQLKDLSEDVELLLASDSLHLIRLKLIIEVFLVNSPDGLQQECVGCNQVDLKALLDANQAPKEIMLCRKGGKGRAGSIQIVSSTQRHSSAISIPPIVSRISTSGIFYVAVLCCEGLDDSVEAVVSVELGQEVSKRYVSDVTVVQTVENDRFVWNHVYEFNQELGDVGSLIHIKLWDDASGPSNVLGEATVDLLQLGSAPSKIASDKKTCVWLPLETKNSAKGNAQLCLAFCFVPSPISDHNTDISLVQKSNVSGVADRIPETASSLTLGSTLTIQIDSLCQLNEAVHRHICALSGNKQTAQELLICAQLVPCGSVSRVQLSSESIVIDDKHCSQESGVCVRGISSPLQVELTPEIVQASKLLNGNLMLQLEIRPSRSRSWSLSFCFGLTSFIQDDNTGIGLWSTMVPCLDQDDDTSGFARLILQRGAKDLSTQSNESDINAVKRFLPDSSVSLAVQSINLPASIFSATPGEGDKQFFTEIWSSRLGRKRAQQSTSFAQTVASLVEFKAKEAEFQVTDLYNEVFFLEVRQSRPHERNQLVGWCFFAFSVDDFERAKSDDNGSDLCISLTIRLHQLPQRIMSRAKSYEACLSEYGEVLIKVRVLKRSPQEQAQPSSMASSVLSDVVYDLSPNSDCRGKFEIQLVNAQNCDSLSVGNAIQVEFRIASAKWRAKSCAIVMKQVEGSARQVVWDECFETMMSWSSRDRTAPTLEVTLLETQQAKSIQLAKIIQKKAKEDIESAVVLGNYDLDLCALLTHSRSWVRTNINVISTSEVGPNQSPRTAPVVSLRVNLRWTPIDKQSKGSSQIEQTASEEPSPSLQSLDGDVSVHVLYCSGNFLRREDSLSAYCVTLRCASESANTRPAASDNDRVTWSEQLLLKLNSSTSPIICVQLHRRTNTLSVAEGSGASSADELVGFLSIPLFPFIVDSQHLMSLSLPIVSRIDQDDKPTFRKSGILTLEIQYFARALIDDASKFDQNIELMLHQVRQMRGAGGILDDRCKHIRFQVLIVNSSSNETKTIIKETGLQCISTSGSSIINEAIQLDRSLLPRIKDINSFWVIILRICNVGSKVIGQVHIPLRRGWEQQIDRKTRAWYPIYTENQSDVAPGPSGSAIELSFLKTTPTERPAVSIGLLGRLYFACKQVILHSPSDRSALNCEAKAWIEIGRMKFTARKAFKSTTKQLSSSGHWSWASDSIAVDCANDCDDQEKLLVRFLCQKLSLSLEHQFKLGMCLDNGIFVPVDQWLVLTPVPSPKTDANDSIKAHLEVQMMYVPAQRGTFSLQLNELRPLPASSGYSLLLIETAFIKCVCQGKIHASLVRSLGSSLSENTEWELRELLQIPFNSLSDCDSQRFQVSLDWIGISRTGDEISLGGLSIDLLPFLAKSNPSVIWHTLRHNRNESQPTGAISINIDFSPGQELLPTVHSFDKRFTRPMTRSERQTLLSQIMTVWKKLFYSLDTNQNERIDLEEFKLLFLHHLNDLALTTDGQQLLIILFSREELCESDSINQSVGIPTDRELESLFAEMDTNEDHEVEWDEFLQFLRLRIERRHPIIEEEKTELIKEKRLTSPVPAARNLNQQRETRTKKREDSNATRIIESKNNAVLPTLPSSAEESRPPSVADMSKSSRSSPPPLIQFKAGSSELHTQVKSLQTLLGLEKKKYDQLHQIWMELQRKHRQLELQHQKRTIQDETKEQWVKQTTEQQEKILKERAIARQKCHVASIVLQSNLRSRLEQKRFQALKLNRANAAVTIQCVTRVHFAKKELQTLRIAHEKQERLIRATVRVQRFLRFQFRRREREMMMRARILSAQIIQKHGRRIAETKRWNRKRSAILTLQCWIRQRLARWRRNYLCLAISRIKRAVLGWICRWQWKRMKKSAIRIKRWWKRMKDQWWEHIEQLDAASCIQAVWRGRKQRLNYKMLRTTLLLERDHSHRRQLMAQFIQARWRYLHLSRARSQCVSTALACSSSTDIDYPTDRTFVQADDESGAVNGGLCENPIGFDVAAEDDTVEGDNSMDLKENDIATGCAVNEDVINALAEIVDSVESRLDKRVPPQACVSVHDEENSPKRQEIIVIEDTNNESVKPQNRVHAEESESESEGAKHESEDEESAEDGEDETSGSEESELENAGHEAADLSDTVHNKQANAEENESAQPTNSQKSDLATTNIVLPASGNNEIIASTNHSTTDRTEPTEGCSTTQRSVINRRSSDVTRHAIITDDALVETAAVIEEMMLALEFGLDAIPSKDSVELRSEADATSHGTDLHDSHMKVASPTAEVLCVSEPIPISAVENVGDEQLELKYEIPETLQSLCMMRTDEDTNGSSINEGMKSHTMHFDAVNEGDESTRPDQELDQGSAAIEVDKTVDNEHVNYDDEIVAGRLEELLEILSKGEIDTLQDLSLTTVENDAGESVTSNHHGQDVHRHDDLSQASESQELHSSDESRSIDVPEGDDGRESDEVRSSEHSNDEEPRDELQQPPHELDTMAPSADVSLLPEPLNIQEIPLDSGPLDQTEAQGGHSPVGSDSANGEGSSSEGEEDVSSADSDDLMLEAKVLSSLDPSANSSSPGHRSSRSRRQSRQMRHLDSHKILSDLHQIADSRVKIDAVQEEE